MTTVYIVSENLDLEESCIIRGVFKELEKAEEFANGNVCGNFEIEEWELE